MRERTELLLGAENTEKLRNASVLIVGLGGVGAFAAEAIARAGVGEMTIIDGDVVSSSNINRQLLALNSTLTQSKAELMAQRIRDINPEIKLKVINEYIKDGRMKQILEENPSDWIVDAIDTLSPKLYLLIHAYAMKRKTVSSMGSGGKLNPSLVEITDISQTYNCPLASHIRKQLHKRGIYEGITAVFSPEPADKSRLKEERTQNKRTAVGTISYMPALFGLNIASVVIRDIIGVPFCAKIKDRKYYQNKKTELIY
ncbi:MAG: tRNA threonylcarbamoyladenosine dehydratase [Bacteroidales bacterium]|nr:tRNA threonylcarbamoyladenosine dehydratase [Bacteroidales bacterium]